MRLDSLWGAVCACVLLFGSSGLAQEAQEQPAPPPAVAEPPAIQAADQAAPAPPTIDTGDNAWMLTSSALVLLMTAPGLAMFYSGLVRKKNVLGVMMQCVFLMGLMTVIWALYGYSLWPSAAMPTAPISTSTSATSTTCS